MVHTSVLGALTIAFLIVILTACGVTNSSEEEPNLSPGSEILARSLIKIEDFLKEQIERLSRLLPFTLSGIANPWTSKLH
jgi:hypothetical protein